MQSEHSHDHSHGQRARGLAGVIESKRIRRQNFSEYRREVQKTYDGFAGNLTRLSGVMTGHATLAGRLFGPRAFDVRHCKNILDAACGDGRYPPILPKHPHPKAFVTSSDLSQSMLRRAKRRLPAQRVSQVAADITRLPY